MPKSDTWPGGVAIESVSGMDSAGSCDSVLSINSGFSDDSLEHLSAEERACLMFLEETIESLEVEEDSGLSNDEPDGLSNCLEGKTALRTPIYQNNTEALSAHEDPNKVIGRDHKPSQKYLVPTPLLLASGNARIISKPMESSHIDTPVVFIDAPDGFRSSPDHQQPRRTISAKAFLEEATAKPRIGLSSDVVDLPPSFIPEPPVRKSLPSDSKAKDGIHKSSDVKSQPKQEKVSSEVPLQFIPPPSDFMDEPMKKISLTYSPLPPPAFDEPPEWIPELPKIEPHVSGGSIKPTEVTKSRSVGPETSRGPLSHNEIENLHKKASMKKAPHLTPLTIVQHSVADKPMTPSPSSEHVPAVPKEYSDSKSPPAVAPKPKKLPSNIIFKSHKDTGSSHPLLLQSERTQMDPNKVRMEALKKLGLLKNEEVETVSPCQSPKFKAKARPESPCNPTAPVEPVQELSRLSESPVPGDVQLRADTLKHQDAKSREGSFKRQPVRSYEIKSASLERTGTVIEPAPQTKNPDRTHVELSPGQLRKTQARSPSVSRLSESPIPGDVQLRADTLKHQDTKSREGSLKRQPVRSYEIKSASLERTGTVIEPASQMKMPDRTHVGLSPGQLRKTQPRPPSVGSAKDFGIDHQADDSTKSLHAAGVQPGNDAQKLPRSNGISVMISPHSQNGENRREALKKLGLLRD